MLKNLFVLLFRLIINPTFEWKILYEKQKNTNENHHKNYLFLIIGLIALLSFINIWITEKFLDIQLALKSVLKQILIYLGEFYITSFVMSEYLFPYFRLKKNKLLAEQFTVYASSILFTTAMFEYLFPNFFIVKIFIITINSAQHIYINPIIFYTIYILWTGANEFLNIQENRLVKFAFFASVPILFTPILIHLLINLLMPGMKT